MRQFNRANFIPVLIIMVALLFISGCFGINFTGTGPGILPLLFPHIDEIVPVNGVPGNVVSINGSNFGMAQGTVTFFDGMDAAAYTAWGDTQIICTVPAGAETGGVKVTNTAGQSNDDVIFTVIKPWAKCLGGTSWEDPRSIQTTADGGYIVAGGASSDDGDVTGNHGNTDFWVVKLDNAGIIEWQKCLGGSHVDIATSIQQTAEGGYIVAGITYSTDGDVIGNHGDFDYWVVKLDDAGNIEWKKCYGGTGDDRAYSIQLTEDGGYVVVGEVFSNDGDVTGNHGERDYWVVKLDDEGTIEWQKCYGGTAYDSPNSIQQTTGGGYVVAGRSDSNDGDATGNHGNGDYWIVKLDDEGIIEWQKCLGGSNTDFARSIQQTADGGYIAAGGTYSNDGDVTGNHGANDYWIVKLDNTGNIEWQKCLGGTSNDYAWSIQQTADGGYIATGESRSNDGDVTGNHGENDCWVVKIDDEGNIEWQKSLGGSESDRGRSIRQTIDGGYIVVSETESNDGDVSGNHGNTDYWVVKLNDEGGL